MILAGKSGGKPKFGCPYCSSSTPYTTDGALYTLGQLLELHEVFQLIFVYSLNNICAFILLFSECWNCFFIEICDWWGKYQETEIVWKCHQPAVNYWSSRGFNPKNICHSRTSFANRYSFLWGVYIFHVGIFSGIVDKLLLEFENRVFFSKKAGRKFMDKFLKKVNNFKTIRNHSEITWLYRFGVLF